MRVDAGSKPLSFLYPRYNTYGGSEHLATQNEMLAVLPFGIYPGR